MDVEINLVGVLLAAVAAMIIGAVWYSKAMFGTEWMKLTKVNEEQAKKEAPQSMAVMAVLAFVAAYVLAHVTFLSNYFYVEESYVMSGVSTGFWMWLGFILYATASNGMFEQRRKKLILLNLGNSLVTFMVMGWVIGVVGL